MKIGILGAMPEEISSIRQAMVVERDVHIGDRVYIEGKIHAIDVVLSFSRWGKVAAACTTTTLIHRFNVDFILFTGVAGAVHPMLNIGDIVIGNGHYQHDMDARPFFQKYQIPLTDRILYEPASEHVAMANQAAQQFIQKINTQVNSALLHQYGIHAPQIHHGMIASGDKFLSDPAAHQDVTYTIDDRKTLAVEMEGAAIAQVCHEHNIPYVIIRTISDKADHSAEVDFQSFVSSIASLYSIGILNEYFFELNIQHNMPCA